MNNVILNPNAVTSYKLKYTPNKTWGFTVSIKELLSDKKVGYAGGYGYDKVAACFRTFLYNYLIKDTEQTLKDKIRDRVDSGALSGFNNLDDDKAIQYFKEQLGLSLTISWKNKREAILQIRQINN